MGPETERRVGVMTHSQHFCLQTHDSGLWWCRGLVSQGDLLLQRGDTSSSIELGLDTVTGLFWAFDAIEQIGRKGGQDVR